MHLPLELTTKGLLQVDPAAFPKMHLTPKTETAHPPVSYTTLASIQTSLSVVLLSERVVERLTYELLTDRGLRKCVSDCEVRGNIKDTTVAAATPSLCSAEERQTEKENVHR